MESSSSGRKLSASGDESSFMLLDLALNPAND